MSLKLTIITLIATILCLLTTFAAIHVKTEKKATNWIVTSRLLIFIILAINIVMLLWQISSQPMWLLLKSIYLVFTICIMEIVFRRIRETFGSPNLNLTLILLLIIYGVLIII